MVEKLNILLNAGVELGKITTVIAGNEIIEVVGMTKDDEVFTLKLTIGEHKASNDEEPTIKLTMADHEENNDDRN